MVESLMIMFSPIRYPTEYKPLTKFISRAIPITYALIAVRAIMLLGRSVSSLWREVLILLVMDVVLVPVGWFIFRWYEQRVRRSGLISHF
jgi:ABC-2 type transport system permease protein